jgi:hypothetical protein
MSDLYSVRTVKTHQKKSASEILGAARVCQMQAGNYEIVVDLPGFDGVQVDRTDSGLMVLGDFSSAICTMVVDGEAESRLDALVDACGESYARGETVQPE